MENTAGRMLTETSDGQAPIGADSALGSPDPPTDDRSDITLQTVSLEETRGTLPEELGCSFSTAAGAPPLLIGKGFVQGKEPSKAAVKVDGRVVVLAADTPGYEGLTAGPTFSNGSTLSIEVQRGAKPLPGTFENRSWPATLVIRPEEGRTRSYPNGIWTCGP